MAIKTTLISLLLLHFLSLVLGCSPVGNPKTYTAEETFEEASIVIYGHTVKDYIGEPHGESYPYSSKHVIVNVLCTLKTNIPIPSNLTLNGNFMWHSCFHSAVETNVSYLISLERNSDDPEGFFRVFEPNVASVGTYEPTDENFAAASKHCGVEVENNPSEICECTSSANTMLTLSASFLLLLASLLLHF